MKTQIIVLFTILLFVIALSEAKKPCFCSKRVKELDEKMALGCKLAKSEKKKKFCKVLDKRLKQLSSICKTLCIKKPYSVPFSVIKKKKKPCKKCKKLKKKMKKKMKVVCQTKKTQKKCIFLKKVYHKMSKKCEDICEKKALMKILKKRKPKTEKHPKLNMKKTPKYFKSNEKKIEKKIEKKQEKCEHFKDRMDRIVEKLQLICKEAKLFKCQKMKTIFKIFEKRYINICVKKKTNKKLPKFRRFKKFRKLYKAWKHLKANKIKKMKKEEKEIEKEEKEIKKEESLSDITNGVTLKTTGNLNVRKTPCGSKITTLSKGTQVTYTGSSKYECGHTWYSIKGSFGNGYAASEYLQQVSSGSSSSSSGNQKINQAGLDLIKSFEGWYSCKYKDPIGLWTIGYGHLIKSGETFDHCLSKQEGEDLLRKDAGNAESCVNRSVKTNINSNQFSALVSFTFNVGCGNLQSSTLLKHINAGDFSDACYQFKRWNKAGGKVLPGLVRRRQAECDLFTK